MTGSRSDHTGGDKATIRRHEHVVDPAECGDALHDFLLVKVNDVDEGVFSRDRNVYLAAVRCNGDVVRPAGERNLLRHPKRLRGDDVERVIHFVAEVERTPIRRGRHPVRHWNTEDHVHDLLCCGIGDVDVVAGGVGLDDADRARLGPGRRREKGNQES